MYIRMLMYVHASILLFQEGVEEKAQCQDPKYGFMHGTIYAPKTFHLPSYVPGI